ncbi:MAG: hypothetical protein ABUT20_65265 [Bacteroidota bacterium]
MTWKEIVEKDPVAIIDKLVAAISGEKYFDVRFDDEEDDDNWSLITIHDYNEDEEVSLRLHADDHYDLHLGYYDNKNDFLEITYPLNAEQADKIPERLRKLLKKVVFEGRGMRIPGNFLTI